MSANLGEHWFCHKQYDSKWQSDYERPYVRQNAVVNVTRHDGVNTSHWTTPRQDHQRQNNVMTQAGVHCVFQHAADAWPCHLQWMVSAYKTYAKRHIFCARVKRSTTQLIDAMSFVSWNVPNNCLNPYKRCELFYNSSAHHILYMESYTLVRLH